MKIVGRLAGSGGLEPTAGRRLRWYGLGQRRTLACDGPAMPLMPKLWQRSRAANFRTWSAPLAFALIAFAAACSSLQPEVHSYIIRLKPGQELKTELARLAKEQGLKAASIVSAVGSLTDVSLRLANQPEASHYSGHFEVVSLSGYLAENEFHVHMAVSDAEGKTIGGHVMEGNLVYTTLVVVIDEHLRDRYGREFDPASKYDELVVKQR